MLKKRWTNMKYTLIVLVGEDWENLYIGIREFPIQKIILIAFPDDIQKALKARIELEKFRVPVEVIEIHGDMFEEFFKILSEIKKREENIILNVASGDKVSACIALSAAFVNGLKAFGVKDGNLMLFPVLKFSYYRLISDKKMRILQVLQERDALSLEELSRAVEMSPPLISYHVHGSAKTEGLLSLGLAETAEEDTKKVKLSTLGKLLLRGYV